MNSKQTEAESESIPKPEPISKPKPSPRRRLMHFLILLSIAAAGTYVALCAMLFFFQPRIVYFPSKTMAGSPKDINLAFEEVSLPSTDGARVAGWFVPSQRDRATLLFCHGNAGNISHRLEIIRLFHGLGLNVFIFDYQGYGRSTGRPSETNTYDDVLASWKYLTEERAVDPKTIVVLGRSLGGPVAAWLANRHTPGGLMLESTFTSLADVGAAHYPMFPVRLLTRYGYKTAENLRGVKCPVLITHSPTDRVVPYEHGRALFEAAPEPKHFLEMTGTHDDGFLDTGQAYLDAVDSFVGLHIKK